MRGPRAGVEACAHPTQLSLVAPITSTCHLGMKFKCFSRIHLPRRVKEEVHYFVVKPLTPFKGAVIQFPCIFFSVSRLIKWALSLMREYWIKGNTFGNMFWVWWYKWELTINDVVLISHVDYHCCSRGRMGMQSLGCAWRTCWRL